jgi:uncharacterized protein YkwD
MLDRFAASARDRLVSLLGAVPAGAGRAAAPTGDRTRRDARGRRTGAALGLAIAAGLVTAAPALAQGQQQGGPDAVLGYAEWAEKVLEQPPDGIQFLEGLESRIFELTNQERRDAGLDPLARDEELKRVARAHTVTLLQRGTLAHETPRSGGGVGDRVAVLARSFIGVPGENLFQLTGAKPPFSQGTIDQLAQTVISGLMSSAGHRANILDEAFDHLAVGAAVQGDRVVVTQVFGDRVAALKEPLPLTVKRGTPLSLDVSAAEGGQAPTRYDYYAPERGRAETLSLKLDSPLAMTQPGRYRLRFYVPQGGGGAFEGYYGPDIVVE